VLPLCSPLHLPLLLELPLTLFCLCLQVCEILANFRARVANIQKLQKREKRESNVTSLPRYV